MNQAGKHLYHSCEDRKWFINATCEATKDKCKAFFVTESDTAFPLGLQVWQYFRSTAFAPRKILATTASDHAENRGRNIAMLQEVLAAGLYIAGCPDVAYNGELSRTHCGFSCTSVPLNYAWLVAQACILCSCLTKHRGKGHFHTARTEAASMFTTE